VAYLLHHLSPLSEHQVLASALIVGVGTALGGLSGVLAAARRHSPPPEILLVRPGEIEIRLAGTGDAAACASLHADGLSDGFFVELGPAFLRAYHRAFVSSPEAVTFVAVVRGRVVGAITGVLRPQAHMRWMLQRRGVALAAIGLISMPVHPRASWRFVRSRMGRYIAGWRRHRAASAKSGPAVDGRAVLSHIVVSEGARGAGLGERLVATFLQYARNAGAERFTLTTLEGAAGASGFYEHLGWEPAGTRVNADGTPVAVFHLDPPGDVD
jgi:GNAT superfamily N-acetyltransferase